MPNASKLTGYDAHEWPSRGDSIAWLGDQAPPLTSDVTDPLRQMWKGTLRDSNDRFLGCGPAIEQDRIAQWLLDELRDEEHWARQFSASQDALSRLAAEARAERAAGRATELDPDKL